MKKHLLALFTILCILLCALPVSAAEPDSTPAAAIDGVQYATLAEAVAAVQDGETIVLLRDNYESAIAIGREVSFGLDNANPNGGGFAGAGPHDIVGAEGWFVRMSGSPYQDYYAAVDVFPAEPIIRKQPQDRTVEAVGDFASFFVNATGEYLQYQWQYRDSDTADWQNAEGTDRTLYLRAVTAEMHNRQFRCIISNQYGTLISGTAKLTIRALNVAPTPPTIVGQSGSVTKTVGETANLVVEAIGSDLTYQWQYKATGSNWKNSSGAAAKTAFLSVKAESYRNGYQYRCIVTGSCGDPVISDAITLTVITKTPLAITGQPKGVKAPVGDKVTFSVTAQGEGVTYRWQYKATGSSWKNSSNGTAASLTVEATDKRNGYQYRCIVTDADDKQLISNAATLSVISKTPLAVTGQPASVKAPVGDKVTFSVTAEGEGVTYQWQYKATGSNWKNSSNGTAASLTVEALSYRDGYQYRCIVTDADSNKITSNAATLSVISKTPLAITGQPKSVKASVGDKVTFSVTAQGEGVTYRWQYKTATGKVWNNSTTGNPKTDTLTVEATEKRNGYQYRCIVTDADGKRLTSNAATLTVSTKTPLSITGQPKGVKAPVGDKVTFTVTAEGEGVTYQWQYKTKTGTSWNNSSNGKTASLTVEAAAYRNGYQYRCIVTDKYGAQLTSDAATMMVIK